MKRAAETLRQDLFAGLTVALFALPQSMAYALLAGVEPKYGLYAYSVGAVIGSLFGSSRHLQTGPTNASSIVAASALAAYVNHDNFMGLVFLITALAGAFPAPLTGEIIATNEETFRRDILMANREPYADGWLVKIQPTNLDAERGFLLDAGAACAEYQKKIEEWKINCLRCVDPPMGAV